MEETLIKAFNCADSLPRCCFIWHLKVGRAALRSPPCKRCSPWGGRGRDRGFRLPLFSQEPWLSTKAAAVATRLICCRGGGEGKGSVVLFKQQPKNPMYNLRRLKSSLINSPGVLARSRQVPFTWRLPGPSIPFLILLAESHLPPPPH